MTMISTGTLIVLLLNALLGIAIPVFLSWWAVKKHKARLSTILIGLGTFIVFALVLESLVHRLVLLGPHGAAIQGNTLYFALYGGLMAGLFEETGRFLSMRYLLKDEPSAIKPAVAYGIGHGGMEMIAVFALSMVSLLVIAIMVNTGTADTLLAKTPAEAQQQLTAQIDQIKTASTGSYLFGLWERLSALTLHVGLSILVWVAVRKGGKWLWLFPAAILLHAFVDFLAVILSKSVGMLGLEVIVTVLALLIAGIAWLAARAACPGVTMESSHPQLPETDQDHGHGNDEGQGV